MQCGDCGQLGCVIHSPPPPCLSEHGCHCGAASHQELYGPASETHLLGASANLLHSAVISAAFKGTWGCCFWAAATASQSLHSLQRAKGHSWRPWSAHTPPMPSMGVLRVETCPGLSPPWSTRVLPCRGRGRAQGMQRVRESQQWWGAQCPCAPGLWQGDSNSQHHSPITATPSPISCHPAGTGHQPCMTSLPPSSLGRDIPPHLALARGQR